jgi:2-polyprenyl-3-methyl-5-hydroxy-6-metoxy-1,4-benzoquinol methylase
MRNDNSKKEPLLEPLLYELRVRKVIGHIPRGGRVCDICCDANGRFLRRLGKRIKEGIGLDKHVEPLIDGKISLRRVELDRTIDLESEFFDCATLLAAIEHLAYPAEIIKEAFRILKPGGVLLITTPSPAAKKVLEFLAFKLGIVSSEGVREHKRYYDKKSLKELCLRAGFSDNNIVAENFEFGYNIFLKAVKDK